MKVLKEKKCHKPIELRKPQYPWYLEINKYLVNQYKTLNRISCSKGTFLSWTTFWVFFIFMATKNFLQSNANSMQKINYKHKIIHQQCDPVILLVNYPVFVITIPTIMFYYKSMWLTWDASRQSATKLK